MNARVLFAVSVLSFVAVPVAAGQAGVTVQGALGTHIREGGDTQSLAVGFSPNEHFDILLSAERTHRPTEVRNFGATRGGTAKFISGEVRFLPVTFNRVSPYVLASAGRGTSRPNVNDIFPDPVTNDAWMLLFGGGVRVAVTTRLSAFADMRFGIQGELDTIGSILPVRGGIAWRF